MAVRTSSHLLWCAAADELSSGGSAFGSEVDNIIGHLDDIKVVFNDEYGMTALDEGIEAGEETTDVVEVETSSRLIKNEERGHLSWHAPSCPILYNPMDCSPPGSSVHGIFQTRILEWVAISYSNHTLTMMEIIIIS